MSAQFVEWLERSGPSSICSMVDGTDFRHVGWDVLMRVLKLFYIYTMELINVQFYLLLVSAYNTIFQVLIPICIHPRHWILADLDLTTMQMVVYDSYRIEPLRQPVEEKLQKFMVGLIQLMKMLR